jgi:NRPS condensation-like uncharacterized protein
MLSVLSPKKRHYLTGIDWIVHVFDYMNKRATGVGHVFQIVMELDGVPAEDELRESLEGFVAKLPVLNGRTRRDYRLAPYWRTPLRAEKARVSLDVHDLEVGEDVFPLLERSVNTPFGDEREHLAFHLIRTGETSHVAVTFDHRLFDAHGAEAFLMMFQQEWEKRGACTWELRLSEPAHLSQWRRKFEAGKQVNRAFLRLAENAPPRVLPLVPESSKQGFRFEVISFNEQRSREIMERADEEAGYLMAMPYTMALTVQILHGIFEKRGIHTGDYVIPVTVDTRPPRNVAEEVFFNHVSFFLFRIQASEVDDFSVLLESVKQQMYAQVKEGLPRSLWEASFLSRIVPLPILSRLMRIHLKGEIASFCFSLVGETGHMATRFMGKEVRRSYHMTRVPIPPGLGVFFHQSQGRLNAYLSYAEGLLKEDEVNAILSDLRFRLGG